MTLSFLLNKVKQLLSCRIQNKDLTISPSKASLDTIAFSIKEFVDAFVEAYATLAENKGLVFAGIFNGKDITVVGNRKRVNELVTKLLTDAIRYTSKGFVVLNVDYIHGKMVICVGDSGTGVNEADMTGRDFSEIRDIIASLRGTMDVISDGGKECNIIVKVPMKIARA